MTPTPLAHCGPVPPRPPGGDGPRRTRRVFTVSEDADTWSVQRDRVALDPYTGAVTETVAWADFPFLAKLTTIGILAHMGRLFGLFNQLALAALALGPLCVLFWAYRMAWLRRPTRAGVRLAAPAHAKRCRGCRSPSRSGGAGGGGHGLADAGVRGEPGGLPRRRRPAGCPDPASRRGVNRTGVRSRWLSVIASFRDVAIRAGWGALDAVRGPLDFSGNMGTAIGSCRRWRVSKR